MSGRHAAISKRKRFCLKASLFAITVLGAPGSASAGPVNQFIGFGDSTMDSGYFRYNSTGLPQADADIAATVAAGGSGTFTGAGVMNTTLLAARFSQAATPYLVGGGGGTNYANGSAQTVSTT